MVRSGSPLAFHCKGYKALGFEKDIFGFMAGFREEGRHGDLKKSQGSMWRQGVTLTVNWLAGGEISCRCGSDREVTFTGEGCSEQQLNITPLPPLISHWQGLQLFSGWYFFQFLWPYSDNCKFLQLSLKHFYRMNVHCDVRLSLTFKGFLFFRHLIKIIAYFVIPLGWTFFFNLISTRLLHELIT